MDQPRIYLDHAATTPLDPLVWEAMRPFFGPSFGNPSSLYRTGRESRRAIDEARDAVAAALGIASPGELIFTGSGSEADNLAIKGVAWAYRDQGRHLVVSSIEHHAVLDAAWALRDWGFEVSLVPPTARGVIDPEAVMDAIRDDTILVSVMHANNETGVMQPVEAIARGVKEQGILFHTDAVQTVGHIPVHVEQIGCDLLTLSAHKFYGPKGIGALYVRRGTRLAPIIHGGGQEQERRAGTENVAAIVGMAKALQIAIQKMDQERVRLEKLRDRLISGLLAAVPDVRLQGEGEERLPGHVNVTIAGVEGESVLLNLDMKGIEASSGSACTSGSIEASHVLLAMGLSRVEALGSIRFTLGRDNDEQDVDRVIDVLPPIVHRLKLHA